MKTFHKHMKIRTEIFNTLEQCSDRVYLALMWVTSKPFKGFLRKGYFIFLIFIYLAALGLSYGMWDLVPRPGIKPRPLH